MILESLGIGEMGVVLALAVVLVEPKKLGKVMREFAKFKRKVAQFQADVKTQLDSITLEEDAREKRAKLQNDKAGMRQWGRDQIKALPAANRAEAAEAMVKAIADWPAYRHAKVIACFSGTLTEVDTEPLLRRILADGKTLVMPYVKEEPTAAALENRDAKPAGSKAATRMMGMAPVADLERDLTEGTFGIMEPNEALRATGADLEPDLVFVPGTCFDLRGGRLGQGLGFYDRYLAGAKALKAGLGFDVQITQKNLALDPHDQLMDVLISEKRLLVFSAPRADAGQA